MKTLRVPALRIRQGQAKDLYSFGVDGKLVPSFASISRVKRNDDHSLSGYQRPEVLSHIAEIRNYLDSPNPVIPNAIVIAFDDRVRFHPASSDLSNPEVRYGTLEIPLAGDLTEFVKPGWIVDGQQRVAAIRDSHLAEFPVFVTAFIAASDSEQREQFILVNSTKPLPKGLVYELLPMTEGKLAQQLQRRRFPALLMNRLNHDTDSPLRGMIITPTTGDGVIKDNSILKMLENSLSDGLLYRYRSPNDEEIDVEGMLRVLGAFWRAVAATFPDVWGLPPRRSRLAHGAGIISLGFIMDAIADRHRGTALLDEECFRKDLEPIADLCRWTEGYWDFGPGSRIRWNDLQNTTKHVQLLSNYLLVHYRMRVVESSTATPATPT